MQEPLPPPALSPPPSPATTYARPAAILAGICVGAIVFLTLLEPG